jgi:CBS domain containing-hemolysin-like protein
VGIALGNWLQGAFGMDSLAAFGLAAAVVLVGLTSLQVVFGELIPKTVALQFPVRTAMYTYLPMKWSLVVFTPFIRFLNGSGNLVLRLFGANHSSGHHHVHSPEEIEMLLGESVDEGAIAPDESERLRAGLRLSRRTARQLMVPRREIYGIDLTLPSHSWFERVLDSPYTRVLVWRGSLEDVQGILHIKDLARHLARDASLDDIAGLLRPVLRIPRGLSAERVLEQLRQHRARLALVVSEFGDIEGLVTLQDLVSELLGEISDEFKAVHDGEPQQLEDGRWRLPGRMPAEDFHAWTAQQARPIKATGEHAETLAGIILERLDAVPGEGRQLDLDGWQLTVERMQGSAIESVLCVAAMPEQGRRHA